MYFHESEKLNSFGVPKNLHRQEGGYVEFSEMMLLKEYATLKLIVGDEGQLRVTTAGNTLPVYRPYCHLSGISIQKRQEEDRRNLPIL